MAAGIYAVSTFSWIFLSSGEEQEWAKHHHIHHTEEDQINQDVGFANGESGEERPLFAKIE